MVYRMNAIDINDAFLQQKKSLFNTFFDLHNQSHSAKNATQLWVPTQFGEGRLDMRKLADATISSGSSRFNRDVNLSDYLEDSIFSIRINIGSNASFLVDNSEFKAESQTTSLSYCHQGARYQRQFARNENVGEIAYMFSKPQFYQYIESLENPELMRAVKRVNHFQVIKKVIIDAKQRYLITKLHNNPYHGALGNLYFESIAVELLIASLESFCVEKPKNDIKGANTTTLTDDDHEKLLLAQELLIKDIRHPPTISTLANSVGLNESKLKRGFKQVFHNTIFNTLNEYRMQHAIELVRKNDMSITEIASEAGYENTSKFIAMFKKIHGVTPGAMRKKTCYSLPATSRKNNDK